MTGAWRTGLAKRPGKEAMEAGVDKRLCRGDNEPMTLTEIPDFPIPDQFSRIRELRVAREPMRLALNALSVARQPRGEGRHVVVLPGFGTNDSSTVIVRSYLGRLGYQVSGWGLGVNTGDVEAQLRQTLDNVEQRHRKVGERVSLVAWSLGGVIAREVARDRPELVGSVVTFGTPLYGPRHTATSMSQQSPRRDAIEEQILERSARPITRPVTSIYSRNDGVVSWQACVDPDPATNNVEVQSSHLGLGLDPDVLKVVAKALHLAER
jgi:dienelactone hydrolase